MSEAPLEKLDPQVVDFQGNGIFLFLESLLHLGGGWSANHALEASMDKRRGGGHCGR